MRVAENPYSVMKKRIAVTLSVDVAAEARPGNMKSLLPSADEALYRAKESGRNRVEFAWARPMSALSLACR